MNFIFKKIELWIVLLIIILLLIFTFTFGFLVRQELEGLTKYGKFSKSALEIARIPGILKYALQNGFISNLFYYDQTAGYYNLIPNLLIGLSVFFPIEIAPLFTIYGSYIILFFIFLYCLFSKSYLFENKLLKTIGCLIFFLTPPNLPHIWMYSLTSQIHLFFFRNL